MLGEKSFELIKDLARQNKGTGVPTFDENGIRQIFDEMQVLYEQNQQEVADNPPGTANTVPGLHFRHSALERNKQCVLAYMSNRLERLRELRWTKGSVLPESDRLNMTDTELDYFNSYSKLLASYMGSIGVDGDCDGLDLTQDMKPPKSIMAEIRVLQDYGEMEVDDGDAISLTKGSVLSVPRQQSEMLIQQGIAELSNH